jgi:hypothetical protein
MIILFNNILGISIFMFEEFIPKASTIFIMDIIITSLYIVELIYCFYIHMKPRRNFWVRFDTFVDLITIIVPLIAIIYQIVDGT